MGSSSVVVLAVTISCSASATLPFSGAFVDGFEVVLALFGFLANGIYSSSDSTELSLLLAVVTSEVCGADSVSWFAFRLRVRGGVATRSQAWPRLVRRDAGFGYEGYRERDRQGRDYAKTRFESSAVTGRG